MEAYDSHAHFEARDADVASVLERARAAGVARVLAVGGSAELNDGALCAERLGGGMARAALGFDRDQAEARGADEWERDLRALLDSHPSAAAVGEVGLDFHYSPESAKAQCELFARQLAVADERALPVVVHTREADDATLGVLDEVPWRHGDRLRGVIHCYSGPPAFAGKALDRGFMVSFSGIVTFRSAETVRDSARYVPDDRLLVETDSPYLAPVPLRGKTNEPAFVVHVVRFLAELRRADPGRLAALTHRNAVSLFG